MGNFALCFWSAARTYDNFLRMAPRTPSRPLRQISAALRAGPDAAHLRNSLSSSAQSSFFAGPDPTNVAPSDSEKYLTFLSGTLEYALFPHARRPIFASAYSVDNSVVARNWVALQIKNNAMDKNWTRSQSVAKIADIFARAFAVMGNCRVPLSISRTEAEEWFDIWRLINGQWMERYE